MVQNNSNGWDSIMCLLSVLLNKVLIKLNKTMLVINKRIVIEWSWKRMSSSIRGDEAFWNVKEDQVGISKYEVKFIYLGLKPNTIFCQIRS